MMRDVQSTWPCTKCPPNRPSARRARSRFTGLSCRNAFRLVRSNVSSRRSNVSLSPRCPLKVRQHPFTATLSPTRSFLAVRGAPICNWLLCSLSRIALTVPTSSIRPVNIDQLLAALNYPVNQQKHRQENGKREFYHKTNKTWRVHSVLLGDRLDHEVGTVADVGRGSEQNRSHGNSDHLSFATTKKLVHGGGIFDVEINSTEGVSQKRQVGGRIVEHRGQTAGDPVKFRGRIDGKIARVELHVIEHRDHGQKNSEKEPADLLRRSKRKFIGRMHTFRCREIRSNGGREHNCFA